MIDINAFNAFVSELKNLKEYEKQYKAQKEKIDNMWYKQAGVSCADPSKQHAESYNQPFLEELRLEGYNKIELEELKLQSLKLKIAFIYQKLNCMRGEVKKAYIDIYINNKSYFLVSTRMNLTVAKLKHLMHKEFEEKDR